MGSTYGLENYTSVAKGLKLKFLKVFEANYNIYRSYIEEVVREWGGGGSWGEGGAFCHQNPE